MWFHNIFSGKTSPEAPRKPASPSAGLLLSTPALRQLDRLCLNTGSLLLPRPNGSRASRMRKPASDFREHRPYAPGDDVRTVDWKASARQEHIFIKQGEDQKAAVVTILLDCSASMAWGNPPKFHAALSLAAALGYMALAHNDRLVLVPVTGRRGDEAGAASRASAPLDSAGVGEMDSLHPLGLLWGKGQAPLIGPYLQAARFQGQIDLASIMAGLRHRKLIQGGLVLVISDLLGTANLAKGLAALPAPTWQVVICHLLHPDEISPDLNGHFEMQDIETGQKKRFPVTPKILEEYRRRLQSWQQETAQICQERNALYSMIPTNWTLENEVSPQLWRDRVVKRL